MDASIVKLSSKGQFTIPISIRKKLQTSTLFVFFDKGIIKAKPVDLETLANDTNTENEDAFWLAATNKSLDFWDNEKDSVWDNV